MLKRATAVGGLLLISLAVPATASAVTQFALGGGVTARFVEGSIVSMRFSAPAFRQVAGRRVVIACTQLGPDRPRDGITWEAVGSEAFRMPKRRRVVRRYVGTNYDYCTLRMGRQHLVVIATSDRGAVLVDEQYRTLVMMVVIASGGARGLLPVTPLASPADTPPPATVGFYTDGAQHAAAVTLSDAGRRLFVEVDADDVLHTNVARYLYAGIL